MSYKRDTIRTMHAATSVKLHSQHYGLFGSVHTSQLSCLNPVLELLQGR